MSYAWIITKFLLFLWHFQASVHGCSFLPSQPELLSLQLRNTPCVIASALGWSTGWDENFHTGNFPDWVSFKENRVIFSLWRGISGGFTHPSSAAHHGTITVPCKPLPSPRAGAVRRNPPPMGRNVSTDTHFAQSNCSCACKVNKQQRRWQELKKVERIKVKKKLFEQSTAHILPLNREPEQSRGGHWGCHPYTGTSATGSHSWTTGVELRTGSVRLWSQPLQMCVLSARGYTLVSVCTL